MAGREHVERVTDSARLPSRPDAHPMSTQDTYRALRDAQDFQTITKAGIAVGAGSAVLGRDLTDLGGENLVPDGSFEGVSVNVGWYAGLVTPALSAAQSYDGGQSMALAGNAGYPNGFLTYFGRDGVTSNTIPCQQGDAIYFEFYAYSSSVLATFVTPQINFDTGTYATQVQSHVKATDGWVKYSCYAIAPANSQGFDLAIYWGGVSGDMLYVDAVRCLRGTGAFGPSASAMSGARIERHQNEDLYYSGHLAESAAGFIKAQPTTVDESYPGTTQANDQPRLALSSPRHGISTRAVSYLWLLGASQDNTAKAKAVFSALLTALGGVSGQFCTSGTFADRSSGALGSFETVGTATAVASPDTATKVSIKATATGRTSSNVATAGMNGFTQISISTDNGSTWTTGALVAATTGNVAGSAQNVPWTVECVVESVVPTGAIKIKLESEQTGGAIGNLAWRTVQWTCQAVVAQA